MRITDNSVIMNIANTELAKKGKLLDILTYMPFVSKQNNNIIVAGKGEPIFTLMVIACMNRLNWKTIGF